MTRPFTILVIFFILSCKDTKKKSNPLKDIEAVTLQKQVTKFDTLPNGKKLLDTYDSGMALYYKEVIGSDTLKGGGITCYGMDDSLRYFYFKKGNTLHLLNQSSKYGSAWSLGILERDFNSFFMTCIDNGNSCPSSYQIFDKKTGLNLMGEKVEAISYAYLHDTLFMLYDNRSKNRKSSNITLFNVRTKGRENYKLPTNLPELCDIQIDKISRRILKISFTNYVGDNFEKTKTYNR